MAVVLLTIFATLLFAGWVVRTYPAFTFLESLTRAGKHFWRWLTNRVRGQV